MKKVFVVGGYIPRGGTLMAYQLGRILHEHFGMECRIVTVGDESSSSSVFRYEKVFESIPLAQLAESIGPQDILIANPSFSNHLFGFRLNCVKLMYVQGYSTYSCIDGGFQHYVCVSSFVRDFVRFVYGIEAPVIPAYIDGEPVPDAPAWSSRPTADALVWAKKFKAEFIEAFQKSMQKRHPDLSYNLVEMPERLSRGRFIELMGQRRYLLALSPVEGFGLPSLEAMSRGTTVVGFHGNGGLEYMRDGINCAVAAYPQFDAIADRFAALLRDPRRGEQFAEQGIRDAAGFTKARFEDSWVRYFRETMGLG